ncbi:MAG: hypothetical protein J0H68_09080 [Sphingobacteriia bacterium]|nr:hypothetical protein [Sphingobacteriia bacterium]
MLGKTTSMEPFYPIQRKIERWLELKNNYIISQAHTGKEQNITFEKNVEFAKEAGLTPEYLTANNFEVVKEACDKMFIKGEYCLPLLDLANHYNLMHDIYFLPAYVDMKTNSVLMTAWMGQVNSIELNWVYARLNDKERHELITTLKTTFILDETELKKIQQIEDLYKKLTPELTNPALNENCNRDITLFVKNLQNLVDKKVITEDEKKTIFESIILTKDNIQKIKDSKSFKIVSQGTNQLKSLVIDGVELPAELTSNIMNTILSHNSLTKTTDKEMKDLNTLTKITTQQPGISM